MRISALRHERTRRGRRLAADVTWEDRQKPPRTLVFEVPEPRRETGGYAWDPFALACMPLALWDGEERLVVEGPLSPDLMSGLQAVSPLFKEWFQLDRGLSLEAREGARPAEAPENAVSASFLSGGVDALSLLQDNHDRCPEGHPGRVRECLVVFGLNSFEFEELSPRPDRQEAFDEYCRSLNGFARRIGVELIPVRTNVRTLYPGFESWWSVGFGACLIACGHACARGYRRLLMASDGPPVVARAAHPCLIPNYGTATTRVAQRQVGTKRIDKVRSVAGCPPALGVLKCCLERTVHPDGLPNCGCCEKCLRTMVELEAVGALARAPTFPVDRLTPDRLDDLQIDSPFARQYMAECVGLLEDRGRNDLVDLLCSRIADYDARTPARRLSLRRLPGLLGDFLTGAG